MPETIPMPRLSDTMEEGTIVRWLKKPGDSIKRGEAIAEIETDKASMQFEAFTDGTLGEIKVQEGQTVPLGETIAVLYLPGESASTGASAEPAETSEAPPSAPAAEQERAAEEPAEGEAEQPSVVEVERAADRDQAARTGTMAPVGPPRGEVEASTGGRVRASPLARRLAASRGVDLNEISGTGPGGRIVRADVEEFKAKGAPAAPAAEAPKAAPGEVVPFTRMQTVVARRMVESKTQVPHFYVTTVIDMAPALRFRTESNGYLGKERGISVNDLFVKAAALTLRKFPDVNASYDEKGIRYNEEVNVGIAVALPKGLVVPVVRNADQKSLPEIGAESRALAEKARAGGLSLSDYEGGTFTISNLGMYGVESFSAIVNPPQAAILAVGAAAQEPVVLDGELTIGTRCRVTLSCDHRIVYGATAAEYLRDLKALLEQPFGLVY